MSADQSIPVPESFRELHADARGRPTLPPGELRERHELCEDLAQTLAGQVRERVHDLGLDRATVLDRMALGLADPDAGLHAGEPGWVCSRLVELLDHGG